MVNYKRPLLIVTESKEKPYYSEITHTVKKRKEERTYFLEPISKDQEQQEYRKVDMEDKVLYSIEEGYEGFFVLNENDLKSFKFEEYIKKEKTKQATEMPVMITKKENRIYIYTKGKTNPWKFKTDGEFLEQATFAEIDLEHMGFTCNHDEIYTRKLSRKNRK